MFGSGPRPDASWMLQVQLKPAANRLQIDIPLDIKGQNVNQDALPAMRLKQLSLLSAPADLATSFAIGACSVALWEHTQSRFESPKFTTCFDASLVFQPISWLVVHTPGTKTLMSCGDR